jgi:TetR/AcrR family transcriptional regulator, transcriptional repressor for nem operon
MKVTRAQAEENRRKVVEAAGRLFKEHGFDGVGLNELMQAVGLTRGGFYKQFASKDELVVEACESTLASGVERWRKTADAHPDDPFAALVRRYLAPSHRGRIGEGCAFAALGADTARHGDMLRPIFGAGVKEHLAILEQAAQASPPHPGASNPLTSFATMVGALVLSRMVDDEALSRQLLEGAADSMLGADTPATAA